MSVLNQMLRDLEKRGAMPDVVAAAGMATVARPALATAPAPAPDKRRRWIWAGVLAIAAAFIGAQTWLTLRVQQAGIARQPLGATQFAGVIDTKPQPAAVAPVAQVKATNEITPVPAPRVETKPAPVRVAETPATVTPQPARAPLQVAAVAPTPAPRAAQPAPAARTAAPATPAAVTNKSANKDTTPARSTETAAPVATAAAVVRSDSNVAADMERATDLIARGRSTEAIDLLAQVLVRQPTHAGARGSLAALLAEAGKREQALFVLLAGIDVEPARFAPPAAQLQAELGDVHGALATIARVPAGKRGAGLDALYAGLSQRTGDHMSAIAAWRRALAQGAVDPVWWVGLGISLEATGDPAEARVAYTRAAAEARLPADVRRYVGDRLAALQPRAEDARKAALANVF